MAEEHEVYTGEILDETFEVTIIDVCRFCTVREERVVALVGEGILTPRGKRPVDWRFPAQSLLRARRALRIAQDFEIELPAVALVLDLLDEIETLRRAVEGRRS